MFWTSFEKTGFILRNYKTIKLQPLMSELSKRPMISKVPSLCTFPKSCVAIKEQEL